MKSEELRVKSEELKAGIVPRTLQYSLRVVKLFRVLDRDSVGRIVGRQLLRSAMSIGANVHEAQAAQSKADFIAKMSIAHKEARETVYWFRLIQEARLVAPGRIASLFDETTQLVKILGSILLTSKASTRK